MKNDNYDEDLEKNTFFESLRRQAPDLFRLSLAEKLYILVPKRDTVENVMKDDPISNFRRHIVRLEEKSNGDRSYCNLDGETVEPSNDGQMLTLYSSKIGCGSQLAISVRILFEETYFTENGENCKLFCISRPFSTNGNEPSADGDHRRSKFSLDLRSSSANPALPSPMSSIPTGSPVSPSSSSDPFLYYEHCLFRTDSDNRLQSQLRRSLSRFVDRITNEYRSAWHYEQLKILVKDEFYSTLRDALTTKRQSREKLDGDEISRLQISTEIYFYRCVHARLMSLLCACLREEESVLNKMKQTMCELSPADWGVVSELYSSLPKARKQLSKLNGQDTPYGKLLCLRKTIESLTNSEPSKGRRSPLSTDDLIPPLAFLIAKSHVFNWMTNILYMSEFHFSSFANDELGYCLACFEAASQFIQDGSMKPVVLMKWRNWGLGMTKDSEEGKNEVTDEDEWDETVKDWQYWQSVAQAIETGDETSVRDCLNLKMDQIEWCGNDNSDGKCHPLCECGKCRKNKKTEKKAHADPIRRLTSQGLTVLHFAALFGQTCIMHNLIRSCEESLIDKVDEYGRTALHWACRVGSQSCTLLLLHHGAKSNLVDHAGDNALHMATSYGHLDCVKALLYFNQQIRWSSAGINLVNQAGEAPLHLAVKFHHVEIVSVLLECGANVKVTDSKGKTAFELCSNFETQRLLNSASPFFEFRPVEFDSPKQLASPLGTMDVKMDNGNRKPGIIYDSKPTGSVFSISSAALVDLNIGKIDKLLKAIADNDLPLVKYFLGHQSDYSKPVSNRCHPLCQCAECQDDETELEEGINVNATGSNGLNALHTAVLSGRLEILQYLMECCDADVNWPSAADGRTCMHFAVMSKNIPILALLHENKASVTVKDSSGDTPLHLAVATGNLHGLQWIFEKCGPDLIYSTNAYGDSLLHTAVKENERNLVKFLLDHGANPMSENTAHMTPAECAKTDDMKRMFMEGS